MMDAITYGEEGDAGPHNEAYFKWYRNITRLHIGRPTSRKTQADLNSVSSQILKFTERLLASCDVVEKLEGKSSDFSSFIDGVRAKVGQLKDACLADFKTINLDDADAATLDEVSLKVSDILAPPHSFIQSIHELFFTNSSTYSIEGQERPVRRRS